MAEQKKGGPKVTFRNFTEEELKKQQENESPFDKITRKDSEKSKAKREAKAQGDMTKAESDEKIMDKMTPAELRANQSPSEAQTMLENKKKKKKKKKMKAGGALKAPANPGLKKLPTEVRNKMGYMKKGGKIGYSKGGSTSPKKCKRDGIAIRGRTRGRMV